MTFSLKWGSSGLQQISVSNSQCYLQLPKDGGEKSEQDDMVLSSGNAPLLTKVQILLLDYASKLKGCFGERTVVLSSSLCWG